jgi:hypothetical protein
MRRRFELHPSFFDCPTQFFCGVFPFQCAQFTHEITRPRFALHERSLDTEEVPYVFHPVRFWTYLSAFSRKDAARLPQTLLR